MWRKWLTILGVVLLLACILKAQIFSGPGNTLYVVCYIPLGRPTMTILQVEGEPTDPFEIRGALFPGSSPTALKAGETLVFNEGGASLRVFGNSGGFVYDSLAAFGPWDQWQGGNMHAGQLMQDYVERTGGFPLNLVFEKREVHRQGSFITGYTFTYKQTFADYPALGFGGLRVTLGDGALVHMTRSLYRSKGNAVEAQPVLSARQALGIVAREMPFRQGYGSPSLVYSVRLGYFTPYPEVNIHALEPVWEVRMKNHTLYLNATTGKFMFSDGSSR